MLTIPVQYMYMYPVHVIVPSLELTIELTEGHLKF